jgi:hypothetical protein
MKKYDEKLRKYVSVEEYDRTHTPKDKEICRGKKPHDFVLVLPDFVSYTADYQFNPEEYYRILDDNVDYFNKSTEILTKMGIIVGHRSWRDRRETRLYICSVCKKRKYEYPD